MPPAFQVVRRRSYRQQLPEPLGTLAALEAAALAFSEVYESQNTALRSPTAADRERYGAVLHPLINAAARHAAGREAERLASLLGRERQAGRVRCIAAKVSRIAGEAFDRGQESGVRAERARCSYSSAPLPVGDGR